jgi:hypothetical protein
MHVEDGGHGRRPHLLFRLSLDPFRLSPQLSGNVPVSPFGSLAVQARISMPGGCWTETLTLVQNTAATLVVQLLPGQPACFPVVATGVAHVGSDRVPRWPEEAHVAVLDAVRRDVDRGRWDRGRDLVLGRALRCRSLGSCRSTKPRPPRSARTRRSHFRARTCHRVPVPVTVKVVVLIVQEMPARPVYAVSLASVAPHGAHWRCRVPRSVRRRGSPVVFGMWL